MPHTSVFGCSAPDATRAERLDAGRDISGLDSASALSRRGRRRRCTGTQSDADTFLTAGHCTFGADAVAIWFDDDLRSVQLSGGFVTLADAVDPGNPDQADAFSYDAITQEEYDDNVFYPHDVGVVDKVIWTTEEGERPEFYRQSEFGALPQPGYWDTQIATRKKDRDSYETVGYGLQWSMPERGNSPSNPNRRSDVNETCAGTSGVYRIDTKDDLASLSSYIG